jgi:F-type H+-transporting ATPase subunit delta
VPSSVSFRYAKALADLVAPGQADAIAGQLKDFAGTLQESGDLRNAIESPAVPPQAKRAVVTRLGDLLGTSDLVRRFLLVLIDHRRMAVLDDICEAFESVVDERMGIVRADVSSARELDETERAQLARSLVRLTGKKVHPRFRLEPSLIGGVVARIGSTVYDGSVKGQLQAFQERLAGVER